VSTGNVGTAVASMAAKAGVDAYVFYPNRLEDTKARACMALGAKVCQVEGNYDEANKRCRELAESTGMDFANITLRPFYAEGAKTAAFEIVEQLEWASPDHIVSPAAGGTLSSRMHKGLGELQLLGLSETDGTQIHIAQPSGCNPIASAILAEEAEVHPVMPETAAHSLAIGAPGDGYLVIDAVHKRGGTAAFASDPEIFAGIDLLAATEGLLTEPAGGTTIAVLEKLAAAGRFAPDDTVVALITGNGLKTLDEHPPKEWPAKIDCELEPMLAALGPFTEEGIEIRDAAELRVKESDRIAALAENLRRMGATVEERPDGLRVEGRKSGKLHGAEIEPHGDHRIAMAFAIAGLAAEGKTTIRDADCAGVSFPTFYEELDRLAQR